MKTYNIAVLSGDGIGPEVVAESLKILKTVTQLYDIKFNFTDASVGAKAIYETGNPLPDETLKICKNADAVLFGAIGDPSLIIIPTLKCGRNKVF